MLPSIVSCKVDALTTLHAILQAKRELLESIDKKQTELLGNIDEQSILVRVKRISDSLDEIPDQTGKRTAVDRLLELGKLAASAAVESEDVKIGTLIRIRRARTSVVEMLNTLLRIPMDTDNPDCVALEDLINEHLGILEQDPFGDELDMLFWKLMRTALK